MSDPIYCLHSTPQMVAAFSAVAHIRQILAFEAALARAEARVGVIPREAAEAIAAACHVENLDVPALYQEAQTAGTIVIPVVRALTAQVAGPGLAFVHFGATSQDAIDTALMLQMREGLNLLLQNLHGVCAICAALAEKHRRTIMAGRTLLQQALPITFGLKAAHWLSFAHRQRQQLKGCRETLAVQFGGAAGTLAALGTAGLDVGRFLAEELGLALPDLPWHGERDRIVAIASALGITAGAIAKIAKDIVLLAQTEVAEVSEAKAPGKGGSSAMPQKNNPVDAIAAQAAARLAIGMIPTFFSGMDIEHERGAGGWQAEVAAISSLFCYTAGSITRLESCLRGLHIDAERMRSNLEIDGGFIMAESLSMALARHLGRPQALKLVQEFCGRARTDGNSLREAALHDPQISSYLSSTEIEKTLDPQHYLGCADIFIDRALASYRETI